MASNHTSSDLMLKKQPAKHCYSDGISFIVAPKPNLNRLSFAEKERCVLSSKALGVQNKGSFELGRATNLQRNFEERGPQRTYKRRLYNRARAH